MENRKWAPMILLFSRRHGRFLLLPWTSHVSHNTPISIPIMKSRQLYVLCFLEVNLLSSSALAWSSWNPREESTLGPLEGRRTAMARIGIVSSALTADLCLGPGTALADVTESVGTPPFDTYNIIPDAGVNLDPKLRKVDNAQLLRKLANSEKGGSIWLGEHHNSAVDHNFQELFIRLLHNNQRQLGRKDQQIAVGLEQVQVQFQPFLDDYVKGNISLKEMRRLVEWDKRWMWNFEGYRGIFEAARELDNVRLLALNVDSEDLANVEKGGYPNLPTPRLRKYINDPIGFGNFAKTRQFQAYVDYVIQPSYEMHRNLGLLKYTIAGEQLDSEMPFRNFLSGRILWDEGMATVAHSWVANTGGLLVGLVGADHVKFQCGIPARFARLSANSSFDCTTVVINPTLIDSRPSGSVSNLIGSDSSKNPELITLQLRFLKDDVVSANAEMRLNPENTGGVLPFADYIVVT